MNGVGYVGEGSTLATLANLAMGRVGEGGHPHGWLRITSDYYRVSVLDYGFCLQQSSQCLPMDRGR